jgi:hypothetical protein
MDKVLELLKSVKHREITGDAKNCCIRRFCCIKAVIRLLFEKIA